MFQSEQSSRLHPARSETVHSRLLIQHEIAELCNGDRPQFTHREYATTFSNGIVYASPPAQENGR